MASGIHVATAETQNEREAVYRFRNRIYVEEMGRYRSVADHKRRMSFKPEEAHSLPDCRGR